MVAEVVESRSDAFATGDIVVTKAPWQRLTIASAARCYHAATDVPLEKNLGVLATGTAAWACPPPACLPL